MMARRRWAFASAVLRLVVLWSWVGCAEYDQAVEKADLPAVRASTREHERMQRSSRWRQLRPILESRGFSDIFVIDSTEQYAAATARRTADNERYLFAFRLDVDSITLLYEVGDLWEEDIISAHWLAIDGTATSHLALVFDNPIHGNVATVLFRIDRSRLTREYRDEHATCQPSSFEDIDADGVPEMLVYVENPFSGDCADNCQLELLEKHGIATQWISVIRRENGNWVEAEDQYRQFYAALADRYDSVEAWLGDALPQPLCSLTALERSRSLFHRWADRARRISGRGGH